MATITNPEDVNGSLSLYANAGQSVDPPTTNVHSFTGKPIWNDGVGLFLSRDFIKSKDSIKLVMEGKKDMEILLECFIVKENKRNISIEHDIYDEVERDKTNIYILDLTKLTNDELAGEIYFKLTKYTGKSRILLAPDEEFKANKTT